MIRYLKYRFKTFVFIFIMYLFFIFISFLYSIPYESIFYTAIIIFYFLFIFIIFDLYKYFKIKKIFEKITVEGDFKYIPKTGFMFEEEYRDIIKKLDFKTNENISKHDKQMAELKDYYTLWAHQIKTPIQALKLLVKDRDSHNQIFKIEQYVEMMMQYLRVDNISNDLVYKKYNLDYLLKQSIKKYSNHFIGSDVKMIYEPIDFEIITDEKWFCFVIEQLLSNSLKYTEKGYIKIYLENLYLVIEDTGIGIKEEDLPRIFEKGYTGYNGRLNKKSSGIGLFLCKKIFDKLGYSISVKTKVNNGSKFYIKLQ